LCGSGGIEMNTKQMTKIISILFVVLNLMSCGQKRQKDNEKIIDQKSTFIEIQVDTSVIAVLPYDTTQYWIFKNAKQSDLSLSELKEIEIILENCIDKYNIEQKLRFEELNNKHPEYNFDINQFTIDLKRYKRQYISVINNKGQKEVWINCFCDTFGMNWKKEQIDVMDGGNCFFNLKVNISKKEYYDFMVNGVA